MIFKLRRPIGLTADTSGSRAMGYARLFDWGFAPNYAKGLSPLEPEMVTYVVIELTRIRR